MVGPLTAFILLSTLCQSAEDQIPVTVVQPGDTVTFTCALKYQQVYWYKQTPGNIMQFVASVYYSTVTVAKLFEDRRFNVTTVDTQPVFTIHNVWKEDEGMSHCLLIDGYLQNFVNSTFLVVNGTDGADSQSCVHVTQSPSSASLVPGRSVSLQCSLQPKNNKSQIQCPQQQQVLWFRAGSVEPHTGLMSHFTNYSCVYSLSKTIGRSSEAGTYYCAVHTCGHILFGTGTTLDIGEPPVTVAPDLQLLPVTVALSVLLCVCVLVIIVLCVKRGRLCAHCRDSPDGVNSAQCEMSEHTDVHADVNYAALNFSSRKVKQRQSSNTRGEQECVYSGVRAEQH